MAPGDMSVAAFLARANNVMRLGPLAAATPEAYRLKNEVIATAKRYKARIDAQQRAGHRKIIFPTLAQLQKLGRSRSVEEALEAYQKFIKKGEIKHIGASNFSAERLQKSLDEAAEKNLPAYEVFQPEYNLMVRDKFEGEIKEICTRNNLGVIPYFSLASGFLTGKYRTKEDFEGKERKMFADKFLNNRGKKILESLDEISEKHNVSQAAVALAWLINRPGVSAPIASATKSSHLKSFTETVKISLSNEDMAILNKASETE